MKAGWNLREIGEAFQTVTGNTPPKSAKHYYGNDVPLVKPPELTDGDVGTASDGLSDSGAQVARVAPEGSVLVSCIGNLGKIGLATRPVAFNQQINAIYPDPTLALPKFTFYQTLSPQFREQLDALAAGTTVSIVNKSRFNSIKVPLPPLEEQQRIVAVLDDAFEGLARARENAEVNLKNARELFESALFDLYEVKLADNSRSTLSEVCDLISGQHIEAKDYNNGGVGIGYLTGPSDFGDVNPVVTKWTEKPKRTALSGDILITVKGSGVGSVNIMNDDELAISRQLMAIRSKGIPMGYLFGFIRMQQRHFQDLSNGAAIPGISRGDVLDLKIPIPDSSVQSKYVTYLADIEAYVDLAKSSYQAKLNDLADLRQSLLQKAFAGELT